MDSKSWDGYKRIPRSWGASSSSRKRGATCSWSGCLRRNCSTDVWSPMSNGPGGSWRCLTLGWWCLSGAWWCRSDARGLLWCSVARSSGRCYPGGTVSQRDARGWCRLRDARLNRQWDVGMCRFVDGQREWPKVASGWIVRDVLSCRWDVPKIRPGVPRNHRGVPRIHRWDGVTSCQDGLTPH